MSNPVLVSMLQALTDAVCDSVAAVKASKSSGVAAEGVAIGTALLSDAELKAKVGELMVAGLSGISAALKDISNVSDDLEVAVQAVPMIEKIVAALKA